MGKASIGTESFKELDSLGNNSHWEVPSKIDMFVSLRFNS